MKLGELLADVDTADAALDNGIFFSDDVLRLKDFLGETGTLLEGSCQ